MKAWMMYFMYRYIKYMLNDSHTFGKNHTRKQGMKYNMVIARCTGLPWTNIQYSASKEVLFYFTVLLEIFRA